METSSVTATSAAYSYNPAVATSSDTSGDDFASLLNSQMTSDGTGSTTGTSATTGEEALTAYNPGQVTAYNLDSSATDETASGEEVAAGEETTESGEKPGYPAEVGQEWVPKGMQFYDTVFGRWVDDDIPHRFNENGDLEYNYEGEWYLDVAVRHRMVYTNGEEEIAVDVSEGTQTAETEGGEGADAATLAAGETTAEDELASTEEVASFSVDEYFNAVLGTWKIFNLPSRTSDTGEREYYWGDSWHADNYEHRTA